MIKRKAIRLILAFFASNALVSPLFGDNHVFFEQTVSLRGHVRPKTLSETWYSENQAYFNSRFLVTIYRRDLQKKWTISPTRKRYLEESLIPGSQDEKSQESPSKIPIREIGWDYEPQYDWIIEKTREKQVINGWECQEVIAEGDADYGEETMELWMSKDVPIDIKRYNSWTRSDKAEWESILKALPELEGLFMVKSVQTVGNRTYHEKTVTKAEVAVPPQGIYELPQGLERVNSWEELTGGPQAWKRSTEGKPGITLPQALLIDLKRLEETWNVLDHCAEKIWTGWNNYKEVPFLFTYPNGMQLLVGHPFPPEGFESVPGLDVGGKRVFIDRRQVVPVELNPPLTGGGGLMLFGKDELVTTIHLRMRLAAGKTDKKTYPGDEQILINIHELFHGFQEKIYRVKNGRDFNTDANYAIYAEIEGLALEKAYLEPDNSRAGDYLKDFIAARELKQESITPTQQAWVSDEDFMEGTAVYAETMALELLKKGYRPRITGNDDPSFSGFKDIDFLIVEKLERLRETRAETMDFIGKCYDYGCFQALLLNRLVPGWQKKVQENQQTLDAIIAQYLNLSPGEKTAIAEGFKTKYNYAEIEKRHTDTIKKRDEAYEMVQARRGRKYIINFSLLGEHPVTAGRGEPYNLGSMYIYPRGLESLKLHEVVFEGRETPMVFDQLYYFKWIDTEAGETEKSYELEYSKKEGENIYYDAVVKTKGFVLKAPKLQVKDRPTRVKLTILSKVKG
jgi:hypothetical protein